MLRLWDNLQTVRAQENATSASQKSPPTIIPCNGHISTEEINLTEHMNLFL